MAASPRQSSALVYAEPDGLAREERDLAKIDDATWIWRRIRIIIPCLHVAGCAKPAVSGKAPEAE